MTIERRPKAKREASLTLRLQQSVKDAIAAEADASSRSMSQVAEGWLDEASRGHAGLTQMLGGSQVADALMAMAELARTVETKMNAHPSEDPRVRAALIAGWTEIMNHAVPFIPMTNADDALADLREDARAALRAFNAVVRELPDDPLPQSGSNQFNATPDAPEGLSTIAKLLSGARSTRFGMMELLRPYIYGDSLSDASHVNLTSGLQAWLADRRDGQVEAQSALDAVSAYSNALWNEIERHATSMGTGRDLAGAILSRRSIHNAAASLGKVTPGD